MYNNVYIISKNDVYIISETYEDKFVDFNHPTPVLRQ